MIDRTTLPVVEQGQALTEGQRFSIKGTDFEKWPDEIVLGYSESRVLNEDIGNPYLMKLVSKTDSELVFEVIEGFTFNTMHTWNIFATPFERPRVILAYD